MEKSSNPNSDDEKRENIVKSSNTSEGKQEKELTTELEIPKFDTAPQDQEGVINRKERPTTNRPKNIYVEASDGKLWLWYNTEGGNEVGIQRVYETNSMTKISVETGCKFNIPASKGNIAKLKKIVFAASYWIFKDGVRRTLIPDIDKFVAEHIDKKVKKPILA